MTVKELIEALTELGQPDLTVVVRAYEAGYNEVEAPAIEMFTPGFSEPDGVFGEWDWTSDDDEEGRPLVHIRGKHEG